MLKDIQKKLLLKFPLIWNTKLVPMLLIGVLLQLIFFALGFYEGTIDFSNQTIVDIEVSAILFGILLVLIIIILWLVNYFKNNSLKSYYTKSKNSLFYEWFQVFIICLLLISFYLSFQVGRQLHQKSYFSLEETKTRCKIIGNANIFIDGYFKETEIDSLASNLIDSLGNKIIENIIEYQTNDHAIEEVALETVEEAAYPYKLIYKDYIYFKNKKFDKYSLMNRANFEFSVFDNKEDSLQNLEVKNWLFNDNQIEIKKLMTNYLKLIKEHNLGTNLNVDKWFKITYNRPEFTDFQYIIPYYEEFETDDTYRYNINYYSKGYRNQDKSKYSKYFVQQDVLKTKYKIASKAHTKPFIELDEILAYLYGALVLSLLIISFRFSSGKSWLISLVSFGILNIIYGVFTAIASSEIYYLYFA